MHLWPAAKSAAIHMLEGSFVAKTTVGDMLETTTASSKAPTHNADFSVGETGFEPATPWSRTKCSTRLSHSPGDCLPPAAGLHRRSVRSGPRSRCRIAASTSRGAREAGVQRCARFLQSSGSCGVEGTGWVLTSRGRLTQGR